MDETCIVVENTLLNHEHKCTVGCRAMVKLKCAAEFLDEIKNEKINTTIRSCNINEELNKILQLADGMVILVRIDKIRIVIDSMVF